MWDNGQQSTVHPLNIGQIWFKVISYQKIFPKKSPINKIDGANIPYKYDTIAYITLS